MDSEERPTSEAKQRLGVMCKQAILQATLEIVDENRGEIISRARGKLLTLGITVSNEEIQKQL